MFSCKAEERSEGRSAARWGLRLLELGSAGNLRTITLRGYDQEEMSGILDRLG
jgi:uncharacterized protein with GYD domain